MAIECIHILLWVVFGFSVVTLGVQGLFLFAGVDGAPSALLDKFGLRAAGFGYVFAVAISLIILAAAFVNSDFSVQLVAQHSSTQLPWFYRLTALWGSHEGSLLLWCGVLSAWGVPSLLRARTATSKFEQTGLALWLLLSTAMLGIMLSVSSPFLRLWPFPPSEGADLNPLLQDLGFVFHPPLLYLGYVGSTLPFVWIVAGLVTQTAPKEWATAAMRPLTVALGFLTLGISLGSFWAYYELGWGGYWFWDPVENASLMPWLAGMALLHTLQATKRHGRLADWSALLGIVTYALALMGTFLVRSGLLDSVHAFASDPSRGLVLLTLLGVVLGVSLWHYNRFISQSSSLSDLSTPTPQPSSQPLSWSHPVTWYLIAATLFALMTLTVALGTLAPIVIDSLNYPAISIGPQFYNQLMGPLLVILGLSMVLMLGVNQPVRSVIGRLTISAGAALLGYGLVSQLNHFPVSITGAFTVVLAAWVFLTPWLMVGQARKRYAMASAHAIVGLFILAVGLVPLWSTQRDVAMQIGECHAIHDAVICFDGIKSVRGENFIAQRGEFRLIEGETVTPLYPEKRLYDITQMPMTEVAMKAGLLNEYYLAINERVANHQYAVRIYHMPLVRLLWCSGLLLGLFLILDGTGCVQWLRLLKVRKAAVGAVASTNQ